MLFSRINFVVGRMMKKTVKFSTAALLLGVLAALPACDKSSDETPKDDASVAGQLSDMKDEVLDQDQGSSTQSRPPTLEELESTREEASEPQPEPEAKPEPQAADDADSASADADSASQEADSAEEAVTEPSEPKTPEALLPG